MVKLLMAINQAARASVYFGVEPQVPEPLAGRFTWRSISSFLQEGKTRDLQLLSYVTVLTYYQSIGLARLKQSMRKEMWNMNKEKIS